MHKTITDAQIERRAKLIMGQWLLTDEFKGITHTANGDLERMWQTAYRTARKQLGNEAVEQGEAR